MGFRDGSGISWTICKQSAPRSRQTTTQTPHRSIFTGQVLFLTPNQQHQSTEGTSINQSRHKYRRGWWSTRTCRRRSCCRGCFPASRRDVQRRAAWDTTDLPLQHTHTQQDCIVTCSVLLHSLAVLDPRVGHTVHLLSPFIPVLCHSDWPFHWESCPRLDVVHPGRAWPSSPSCTWHCSLRYLFLQATPLFPHGVTIVC